MMQRNGVDRRPLLERDAAIDTRALVRAAREADRESAEARDRARRLAGVLAAFTAIASAQTSDDIIATLLRAARRPLGFERAMWLEVEETKVVILRHAVDRSDRLEHFEEVLEYDAWSSLSPLTHGRTCSTTGHAGELGTPIVDVRSAYALVAIGVGGDSSALLYVDGSPSGEISLDDVALLESLAAITSTALQKLSLLERMQILANRDPLTGLYNRRAFAETLAIKLQHEIRSEFVFAIIDIDDFKTINDSRGHAVGDAVLKRLARTLLAGSRAEDTVGRFAGDEFVVILDGVSAVDADAMVARLSAHIRTAGISCSIGAAAFPSDAVSAEALFTLADHALYIAKANGKNRHAINSERRVVADVVEDRT